MDITTSSLPEGNIRLRDGRRLAYAEYGDPLGKPIFFFHGTPGSRLFHYPDTAVTASTGARIIAVDRPGFGRSDFKPGRTLLGWPGDVLQLADALNIERFVVMGYCGGGPYALACASTAPDRVVAVGLVSSMSPLDNPRMTRGMHGMGHLYFSTERHLPPLANVGCQLICTTWRNNPGLYFRSQVNGFLSTKEAQRLLPKLRPMMIADFLEAIRAGSQGITRDLEILARPWGFHLHTLDSDVFLWHGENDTQAPVAMGKRLASAIPHCRATFYPGEGHWAIHSHWQQILTALVQIQPTVYEEPLPQTIVVPALKVDNASETVVSPACSDVGTAELGTDAPQGLQPVREAAAVTPSASSESNPVIEVSAAADAAPEPAASSEAPKVAAKKTGKRRVAGTAEAKTDVAAEPAPAKEPTRKAARRRTAAAAGTPQAARKPKTTLEKKKAATAKTARRPAPAAADRPMAGSSEAKAPGRAGASAKKAAKPGTAVKEPMPVPAPNVAEAGLDPAEPGLAKTASRRRSTRDAVLV